MVIPLIALLFNASINAGSVTLITIMMMKNDDIDNNDDDDHNNNSNDNNDDDDDTFIFFLNSLHTTFLIAEAFFDFPY